MRTWTILYHIGITIGLVLAICGIRHIAESLDQLQQYTEDVYLDSAEVE